MVSRISKYFHQILVFLSSGYFIYDTLDLLFNDKKKGLKNELFIHHGFIIACFGLTVATSKYIPFAQFALLCEVNSIFLHARQLMIIRGVPKSQAVYRLVSVLNIGKFSI
jgi:hypothetical protein